MTDGDGELLWLPSDNDPSELAVKWSGQWFHLGSIRKDRSGWRTCHAAGPLMADQQFGKSFGGRLEAARALETMVRDGIANGVEDDGVLVC